MPAPDIRDDLKDALAAFSSLALPAASTALFKTLGYESKRTLRLTSVKQFCAAFDRGGKLTAKERASLDRLSSLHFLFQLTDAELSTQSDLFTDPGAVDDTRIHSYLFLAAELPAGDWSRTELTALARALNKPLPMPALVLFKHGNSLSLAVIHRRLNKVSADRDVLEKATLIRGIRCAAPHRAHVEILADLAFDSLQAAHGVSSFVQLHAAWRETLDIQELNKKFYQQLQHWYFWALGHARFPADAPKDTEDRDALSLIRLLTRLIFVWFLKEKGLVPENLFDDRKLAALLKGFAPANAKAKDSVYYRAILQNLFFATLNCEQSDRAWAKDGQNMMAHSLYRFRDEFASPASALDLFKEIPFLNGGLFECLDKPVTVGGKARYIRIDGFSRRDDSQPVLPDFLFFGPEHEEDLSEFYEEKKSGKKARPVKVRGLISILQDFKFTIEENTPLEEDVALDPELLGRVFENLLAAYNPETQVTARKQTGSFYTPREIVDYMTGQALFYALREKLQAGLATKSTKDAEAEPDSSALSALDQKLQSALAHDDAPNPFNTAETDRLIAAIDDLKILDPACGSGAFPMGVLHRLVHLLGKLDPGNARWKQRQLDKVREVPDPDVREQLRRDVEQAFAANELGYGRKLYLIENCLYGVDIQPIAAQITKLRFFISLVVEQKVDAKAANRGIRPLPNLETKIVAANTLIGVERKQQQADFLVEDTSAHVELQKLRLKLTKVRDDHFLARTPKTKAKCREDDCRIRDQMSGLLEKAGMTAALSRQLAAWDPYDQNDNAPFFDNEWMFGLVEGFDIVIGNPPYRGGREWKEEEGNKYAYFSSHYAVAEYQFDIYALFWEQGIRLTRKNGVVAYITPNTWLNNQGTTKLREYILNETCVLSILDCSREDVFSSAVVLPVITLLQHSREKRGNVCILEPRNGEFVAVNYIDQSLWSGDELHIFNIFLRHEDVAVRTKIEQCSSPLESYADVKFGIKLYETGKGSPPQKPSDARDHVFEANRKISRDYRPYLEGKDVDRFCIKFSDRWLKYGPNLAAPREPSLFEGQRLLFRRIVGNRLIGTFVESDHVTSQLLQIVKPRNEQLTKRLLAVLNSGLIAYYFKKKYNRQDKTFPEIRIYELASLPVTTAITQGSGQKLDRLTDQILAAKRADPAADTSRLEAEIDRHVYALYGLTEAEIALVEGKAEAAGPLIEFAATKPAAARPKLGHPAYFQLWIRHALGLGRDGVGVDVLVAAAAALCDPKQRRSIAKQHAELGSDWQASYNETPTMADFLAILLQMAEMKAFTIDGNRKVRLVADQAIAVGPWVRLDAYFALDAAVQRPTEQQDSSGENKAALDKIIQRATAVA